MIIVALIATVRKGIKYLLCSGYCYWMVSNGLLKEA